ncbi:cytochrome [Rhodococcus sp. NPDC019627]|uniref:Putative cytochrome P450 n=1 Tax=Rhodococcus opacus (strain B4) TaxID=632772 RepID=C1BDK3_RHOOB|nr:hypothetical protein [Rhodococcus opacus]BAH47056.1 putative cytochrome P450 [Rhodococcus opacus B4]
MMRGLTYSNSNLPPILQKTIGRRQAAQHQRDIHFVMQVVDDVIKRRKTEDSGTHNDLLARMLTEPGPETGEPLDEVNVRNQTSPHRVPTPGHGEPAT